MLKYICIYRTGLDMLLLAHKDGFRKKPIVLVGKLEEEVCQGVHTKLAAADSNIRVA